MSWKCWRISPARTSIAYFHEPNFDAETWPRALPKTLCWQCCILRRQIVPTQEIRALDVTALRPGADPAASSLVASTGPLKRGLEGGALIYGEHLFAKVSTNFLPPISGRSTEVERSTMGIQV